MMDFSPYLLLPSLISLSLHIPFSSLQHLPTEHARQAFMSRDVDKSGTIPALEFVDLMKKIRGFRMSEHIQDHLLSVSGHF